MWILSENTSVSSKILRLFCLAFPVNTAADSHLFCAKTKRGFKIFCRAADMNNASVQWCKTHSAHRHQNKKHSLLIYCGPGAQRICFFAHNKYSCGASAGVSHSTTRPKQKLLFYLTWLLLILVFPYNISVKTQNLGSRKFFNVLPL